MRRFRSPVSSDKRFKQPDSPDMGPAERWQHAPRQLTRVGSDGTVAARNSLECMLDKLHEKGQVTPKMHAAGLRLRRDFMRAKIEPRLVMRYTPTTHIGQRGFVPFERSEKEELAYKDWRLALQVVGVGLGEAVVTVCCLDLAPKQSQQRDLIEALETLVKYYKI